MVRTYMLEVHATYWDEKGAMYMCLTIHCLEYGLNSWNLSVDNANSEKDRKTGFGQ